MVTSIAVDSDGYLWIGTIRDGLVKFDGTNWTRYDTSNSDIPNENIRSIDIDGSGFKWIGTWGGGLVRFDDINWTTYDTSNSGLPSIYVLSIAIDGDGTKWIGTYLGGLTKYDGTSWTTYNTSNSGLPLNNDVQSIAIDGNGNKWMGNGGGLTKYDGTNWTTFTVLNSGLPDCFVLSLSIDSSGTKWIGTWNGGLGVYNENGIPFSIRENIISGANVKVFPNPVYDYLTVELLSNTTISLVEIINMQGSLVKSQKISKNKNTIDVSDLSGGIYFVKVTNEKTVQLGKVIKQ
jgi:ligand-binding sensor domain-containing protein